MSRFACPIALTGLGVISSAGIGLDAALTAVQSGTSCLKPVPAELTNSRQQHLWGPADQFKAADFIAPLKARKLDRASQMAVAATGLALADAGLDKGQYRAGQIGIALGCGFGGIVNSAELLGGYFKQGVPGLSPMLFPNTVANAAASNTSIEYGLQGPNITFIQRFCSAESAILAACRFLEEGRADIMLAGGVDELNPLMIRAFSANGQLQRAAAGFGEGAGILVLERGDHAAQRTVRVRAELVSIETIGYLLPGLAEQGLERLTRNTADCRVGMLSGVAPRGLELEQHLRHLRLQQPGLLLGRSLAMGGTVAALLTAQLGPGEQGLQLAASPEGPFYSLVLQGGPAE